MTCRSEQIRLLLKLSEVYTQRVAAAKAGMSLSSAKRYLSMRGKQPTKKRKKSSVRNRVDPFEGVWNEVKDLLERDPGLEAKTLMEVLIEKYPSRFSKRQERTLRRRVHDWRVLEGPERKEVMFLQNIQPGVQSQSDYTHCSELGVTLAGCPFPHLLYHFMLPYSRWEFVWICFTESFETLTEGFTRAVAALGAVAPEHRTDNLAAAVPIGGEDEFQYRWTSFLGHYSVHPSANTPRKSNENGSVEKSHDLVKRAIDQRLRLRGSRDFASRADYEAFLDGIIKERNRCRRDRLAEEKLLLKPLPAQLWNEPRQVACTVTAWSTVRVLGATYSVPSRYIAQKLKALVYFETVEIYYGRHVVTTAPRQSAGEKCINYRHLIFHLMRKPGAFRNYQFKEELFPRAVFREAYDRLLQWNDDKADKEYLRILNEAAMGLESDVAIALGLILQANEIPLNERVRQLCSPKLEIPKVTVLEPDLRLYDNLLPFRNQKEF